MTATTRSLAGLILAASIASTIGDLPFNTLPLLLGSLADSFHLPAEVLGYMGSVCFAGYFVGTLGAPIWMDRLNWRALTAISAAGTALAFLASAHARSPESLYVAWAAIGFFASTMTCLGMRILADLPNKERSFGVRQGTSLAITAGVLFVLPPFVIAVWHFPGAAAALAAIVALLGLSAIWVPRHPLGTAAGAATPLPRLTLRSALPLGVFLVFLTGNIAVWAFLERMGAARHISSTEMGTVFAVLKVMGGIAAFAVAAIGSRLGRRLPHLLAALGIGAGLALLGTTAGFGTFALGAWLWEFAFTAGCVFQTAAIARADPSGRAIVLVPAVFAAGSMIGPALGGRLASGDTFGHLLWLALACALVPLAFYFAHGMRTLQPALGDAGSSRH